MRSWARSPQAHTREGSADLGAGMGQGGQEGRLAKADAAARVRGFAEEVGGGADLLLAWPEQEDEQGLRALVRERGSVRLRGHDSTDGEASGSCLRLSRQFLRNCPINLKYGPTASPSSVSSLRR